MKKIFLLSLINFSLIHCMHRPEDVPALSSAQKKRSQFFQNFLVATVNKLKELHRDIETSVQIQERNNSTPLILEKNKCPFCLITVGDPINHITYFHRDVCYSRVYILQNSVPTQTLFPCVFPGCGKEFKWPHGLKDHAEVHERKPFLCTTNGCKIMYETERLLLEHLKKTQHQSFIPQASSASSHDEAAAAAPVDESCTVRLDTGEINTHKRPHETILSPVKSAKFSVVEAEVSVNEPFVNEIVALATDEFVLTGDTPTPPDLDPADDFLNKKRDPLNPDGWPV